MKEFESYKAAPGPDTLRALLQARGDAVYNVCFQVLRDPARAEDAAQHVLLDLVRRLPGIRDASHLGAWISRAAFHAALDLKKEDRRRAAHERRTAEMKASPALSPDQIEAVHSEIARLDDDLRAVVVEHYFEKRPLKDLAADRAVSEVAVWKRLEKAKERLRATLAATGFASALLGLDSLLEALEPVRAPEGLISPGLWAQASVVAPASLWLLGGFAVKTKLMVVAGVLMLVGGIGYGVARQRQRRVEDAPTSAGRETNDRPRAAATTVEASPVGAGPAQVEVPEELLTFTSFRAYYEALMKASYLLDTAERARAFRRIGIRISDADMAALSRTCPFRPGTEDFSKHVLNGLDKGFKNRDPRSTLAMFRTFTDLDEKTRKQLMRRMFEELDRRDPAAARELAATLTDAEGREDALARLEPPTPEALSRALARPEGSERSNAVSRIVSALTRADPAAALRTLEALPAGQDRTQAFRVLAGIWGRTDFAAALAWVDSVPDPETRSSFFLSMVSGGAEGDPKAAAEAALKRVDPKDSNAYMTIYSVVRALAATDLGAAVKFLDRFPTVLGCHIAALQEVAPRWGAADPVEALVWAQSQKAEHQAELIQAVLAGWVKSPQGNLAEARAMVGHLPEALRPKALQGVVLAWGEIDPPAAAAFALAESPDLIVDVVGRWAKRDGAAALAWARDQRDPGARDKALLGVSRVWGVTDIPKAVQAAEDIRDAASRDLALGHIATSSAEFGDLNSRLDVVRKIGDVRTRDGSLSKMASRMASDQPRKALAIVDAISDATTRAQAVDNIITFGSEADPQACREMLSKLPRVNALQYQRVAGGFAKKDPAAAAAWALTLPEKQMDPMIGEPSKEYEARPRESALNSVLNTWGASDPDAAVRWIKAAALSDATRSSLLHVVSFQRKVRNR
jgi:RNA polymerase sigma factor (sigma-70 family)